MILEAVLQDQPGQSSVHVSRKKLVESRSKRRGEDLLKPVSNKEGRMEGKLNKGDPKGYDLRLPVDIWYWRAWSYEGERVSKALNVLHESLFR